MKKITKVADLIGIIRTAKAGGQFATIDGAHTTKFNQFPNEDLEDHVLDQVLGHDILLLHPSPFTLHQRDALHPSKT